LRRLVPDLEQRSVEAAEIPGSVRPAHTEQQGIPLTPQMPKAVDANDPVERRDENRSPVFKLTKAGLVVNRLQMTDEARR
jgi:hypothetical protein